MKAAVLMSTRVLVVGIKTTRDPPLGPIQRSLQVQVGHSPANTIDVAVPASLPDREVQELVESIWTGGSTPLILELTLRRES